MLSGALWPEAEQNSTMMLPAFLGQYQAVRVCRSGLGGMDRPERRAGQTRCRNEQHRYYSPSASDAAVDDDRRVELGMCIGLSHQAATIEDGARNRDGAPKTPIAQCAGPGKARTFMGGLANEEFDRHDDFDRVAHDIDRRFRQGLRPTRQVHGFGIERSGSRRIVRDATKTPGRSGR